MNFAFYVSGKAGRVKKFLKTNHSINLINNISFVLIDNKNNEELRNLCRSKNIKFYEIDLDSYETSDKNKYLSDILLKYSKSNDIDYVFVFGNRIVVGDLLNEYKNKLINFHPSILPMHKGLSAIDSALTAKTFLLGNTTHFIDKGIDTGPIIMQNIYPAINFKNYEDVLDKQIIMLHQLMEWIIQKRLIVNEADNKVYIEDANYEVSEFIPNIEIKF